MLHARASAAFRRTGIVTVLSLGLMACAAGPEPVPQGAAPEPMVAVPTPAPAPAAIPVVRSQAPERYVVREGDTLWDIANVFLRDPWYWAEVWLQNPQVRNPHQIYPGDVLYLHVLDGRPRVTVALQPRIRIEALEDQVFPISALQPFMFRPRVVDAATLDAAPYILAAQDERVIFGPGDRVYVRHAPEAERYDLYHVVRRDRLLVDPDTGEELGIATIPIAEAEIVRGGDVATAVLRTGEREAIRGDRLIGFDEDPNLLFDISRPPAGLEGQVILLFDAISQIGTYQAAVINRGARDGVEDGQVFAAWEAGRSTRDVVSLNASEWVALPEEEIGSLMVFRTFEKVAYGLILTASRPIREGYRLRSP